MRVINLYGGPGVGKSTIAASLFAAMKWRKMNVEYVTEYAKDLVWEGRHGLLSDQLYITAKQNRRLKRLEGQVDWAITDSPLLLGHIYAGKDTPESYHRVVDDTYNSYVNINVRLLRRKDYVKIGRMQTEDEAKEIDDQIHRMLELYKMQNPGCDYHTVEADEQAVDRILEILKEYN